MGSFGLDVINRRSVELGRALEMAPKIFYERRE